MAMVEIFKLRPCHNSAEADSGICLGISHLSIERIANFYRIEKSIAEGIYYQFIEAAIPLMPILREKNHAKSSD